MRYSKYQYNPATCRYEPVPFRLINLLVRFFVFLLITSAIFVSLLFIHSALFTTENEKRLQTENSLLSQHYRELIKELKSAKTSMVSLYEADKNVHEKIAVHASFSSSTLLNQRIESIQDESDFTELLTKAQNLSKELLSRARHSNYYFGNNIQIDSKGLELLTNIPALQPIDNPELTCLASGFGQRTNPFHGAEYFHRGIDFVAPRGTPIYASASGKVSNLQLSDLQMGKGNVIEIDHGNGFKTRYAHLGDVKVKVGQKITKGDVIAIVGLSGGSTAPHLHFEVLKNNKTVDPIDFIMEGVSSDDYEALRKLSKQKNQSLD